MQDEKVRDRVFEWQGDKAAWSKLQELACARPTKIAVVGKDAPSTRSVIEHCLHHFAAPNCNAKYLMAHGRVEWPNGSVMSMFSATTPWRLRGLEFDAAFFIDRAEWPRRFRDVCALSVRLALR